MLAPRTPTADGIGTVLVYPGAVLRSNTVVPMALLSAHVAGGCGVGVHGLAYALVASWICVQPITMCPDAVGSCSIGVAKSGLLDEQLPLATLNQLAPPSLVRLVAPY